MPKQRKPVVHAITPTLLARLLSGDPAPEDFLERLARSGLRIARVPGRPRFRDAESGHYVSPREADRHPEETVRES